MKFDIGTAMPSETEEKMVEAMHRANKLSLECVEAREHYACLEDNKKSYFAKLVEEAGCKTNAEGERRASLSFQWSTFIVGLQSARKKYETLRAERDCAIREWETMRSLLSSLNAERRMS